MTMLDSSSRQQMNGGGGGGGGGGGNCFEYTPHHQKQIIVDIIRDSTNKFDEGTLYYILSNRWFECWRNYVGYSIDDFLLGKQPSDSLDANGDSPMEGCRPGPIDNIHLLEKGCKNKSDDQDIGDKMEEQKDYVLVPQKAWEKFVEWYGGGPALPRKLIYAGFNNTYIVEVFPLRLKLIDLRDDSKSIIRLSRKASVRELYEKVCSLKRIKPEEVHIWDYFGKQKQMELAVSDQSMEEVHLQMDQDILLELRVDKQNSTRNDLALVPMEPPSTMSNGRSTDSKLGLNSKFTDMDDVYYKSPRKGEKRGLAGLNNLGNTCFMNSALQCLVHTPPIVDYFLQDYTNEINKENLLGMHGELAHAFGELLRKLWSSGSTTFAPRVFKGKLARFAPQFSGYNQHDSQELLAFLLDGLHEDLNRVKRKPYIEIKDSDGRPDEVVAEECWNNHKARNDSLIVDVCQGQYKSTLVCPDCGKISITFDPFMYLSLPLPSTVTRTMTVTVFYGDGIGLPMPSTVTVLKHGYIKDLVLALSADCGLKSDESLLLAEVYENQIFKFFENPSQSLTTIKDEDLIVAYRIKKGAGKTKLVIVHRWQEKSPSGYLKANDKKIYGTPLVTCLDMDLLTGADIENAVSRVLLPLKRMCFSSAKTHNSRENGFLSDANEKQSSSSDTQLAESNQNMEEDTDQGESSSKGLSFQLYLTDDKAYNFKPIEKDFTIRAGQVNYVLLEWTEKEHESYDKSYLKDMPEVHKSGFAMKKTRQEAISLFSCLDAFLTEEPLGPDDMWYCPKCKEHRQATKKLDLWTLPEILIFHLKRFSYSRYLKNKLDTFVNFPIHDLNLDKYVTKKDGQTYTYELYAISNHYGGLGGGHYTAYAKLIDENRWYHFDDSHVSPVDESEIKNSAAYLLFYQRVRTKNSMGVGQTSQGH